MSDIAARREARRRKILENSESRLRRIAKIDEKDTDVYNVDECARNHDNKDVLERNVQLPFVETNREDYSNDLVFRPPVTSIPEPKTTKSSIRNWLFVIFVSSLQHIFILNISLTDYNLNNIFLPFLIHQLIEYTYFEPALPQDNFIDLLLILNVRMEQKNLRKLVLFHKIVLKILQNLMIYFFGFVFLNQISAIVLDSSI